MGYDVTCECVWGKQSSEGKAQLETDFLQFRSDAFRFKASLKDLGGIKAADEFLEFKFEGKPVRLQLGEKQAARWANKILNPPGRLEKLGIKPEATVHLDGKFDEAFESELKSPAAPVTKADLILLSATDKSSLVKVPVLAKRMRPYAALWIVYPKGRTEIREMDVITAGRASGLKDVKVMRFSETDTALKFVVPL